MEWQHIKCLHSLLTHITSCEGNISYHRNKSWRGTHATSEEEGDGAGGGVGKRDTTMPKNKKCH